MIVRLIAFQIPQYWDIIKLALKKFEDLGSEYERGVYHHVFAKLMMDKMQCFVMSEGDQVTGVIITELLQNEVTLRTTLNIRVIYVFEEREERMWKKAFGLIKRSATRDECDRILLSFHNPLALELSERMGFEEISKVMELSLGD